MGCMTSTPGEDKASNNTDAQKAIKNFLEEKDGTDEERVDKLWKQFDTNKDGQIDEKEFDYLVYQSLLMFCKKRNPDLPPPSQENMKPFIKKLVTQLKNSIDKDQNNVIEKDEFKNFGAYLDKEFAKLTCELRAKA